MECIFYHNKLSNSKSVEDIIPESSGNKKYMLSQRYVNDKCNHYFVIKIKKKERDYNHKIKYVLSDFQLSLIK